MGGSIKQAFSNPVRALTAVGTFGTSELARKMGTVPKYIASLPETAANSILGTHYGETGNPSIGGSGPFTVDPAQIEANRAAILGEGNKQYADTLKGIDEAGASAQQYAGQTLDRMLPGIYEDLNSRKLLNSSALPVEIGRQASNLAQDVAAQQAQAKLAALSGRQGFESQALQRGLSMEDFITNANVAKTLGSQLSPQVNNGKANTGALLQGAGALAGGVKGLLK